MECDPTRVCELLVGLGDVEVLGVDDEVGAPPRVHIRRRASRPDCGGCGQPDEPVAGHGGQVVAPLGRGRAGGPQLEAAQLASAHPSESPGARLPTASQHASKPGVSASAHSGVGRDGVADPSTQRG